MRDWRERPQERSRGAQRIYSDAAIMMMASLQQIYRLPLRATQGFLASIFAYLKLRLPVPHYSTLARRRVRLSIAVPQPPSPEPIHLLVDSTGIKVYGTGEWMRWKHHKGKPAKHRRWRVLHIGVNAETVAITAAAVTDNDTTDAQMFATLLEQTEGPIAQGSGDAAYDKKLCYEAAAKREARATIRPRRDAKIWRHGNRRGPRLDRDENLRMIRRRGRAVWKRLSGYSMRALAEMTMARLKMIFGDRVRSHCIEAQRAEILLRCAILNRMTALGLPPAAVAHP